MLEEDWHPTRLGAACEAAKALLEVKNADYPHDRVAIISFGDSARVIHAPAWVGLYFESLTRSLDRLEIEGSTNMGAGLRIAEAFVHGKNVVPGNGAKGRSLLARLFLADEGPSPDGLQQVPHGVTHRVLLLTDGGHNGDVDPLPVARRLKATGVVIDALGIGGSPGDVDEDLLRELASMGPDGKPRYAFIGDKAELVTKFKQLGHHLRLL
jgi:hypothetical protein